MTMSRYFRQTKAAFESKAAFKDAVRAKGAQGDGEIRYNNDLLPTPLGQYYYNVLPRLTVY